MKKQSYIKLISLIFILIANYCFSQENNKCVENIDFLMRMLSEKSVSYQNLITDKNNFNQRVNTIKSIALKDTNPYNCSEYLEKILRNINDGHLQILVKNNVNFKDSISVNNYLQSIKFNSLEKINIDSLIANSNKSENILHSLNDNIDIYIIENQPNSFKGYVVESNSKFWKKGELVFKYSKSDNFYEGVSYNILKNPRYYKTSTLNELFKKFNISKFKREDCKIFNDSKEKLSFKIIDNKILYVSIRSFKNNTKEENKEFVDFFENSVLPNYTKYENIIFDVRNNSGGAMAYETLMSGIKKNKDSKNVFVLQNRKTASAAEHFILHLSKIKKIETIGENTMGMTAFRDINQLPFPNFDYTFFFPVKIFDKNYKDLLQYEYVGIPAQVELQENEDWLNKTIEIIKKNFR